MVNVLICSYLEPDLVEAIRQVSLELNVHFEPDLIPAPRYAADHIGKPFSRTDDQKERWNALLENAEVLFDFDYSDIEGMKRHAEKVRWIQASSAGIGQFVERHKLYELGATLTTAAGVHARPLAEFVLWAILSFTKNYPLAQKQQRERVWQRFHNDDLEGKTLAVVGLGSIGREIAALAKAVGLRVIGSKREVTGLSADDLGVDALFSQGNLHTLLAKADYVCLICPHTPETEGMMDAAALASMKPGSVLINVGRGALVQEEALLEALRDGPLDGAVLDVTPQEPLPPEHPLWAMENVFIFPHSASTSKNENKRLVRLFTDNLKRYLQGEALQNVFDYDRLY